MVNLLFLILALVLALSVSTLAFIKLGRPYNIDSVSNVSYILGHDIFSYWILALGWLLMPTIIEYSGNIQYIGFLSIVGLFIVAATPNYKTECTKLHWIGGTLWLVTSIIIICTLNWKLMLIWIIYFISFIFKHIRTSWLFYAEMLNYILLVLSLLLTIITDFT